MRDAEIRAALRRDLEEDFGHDPSTRIIDELGLCQGESRIDVALVNGALHGYEIKSAADTLERLPLQAPIYNRTLDTVTIICAMKHVADVQRQVPIWWGITQVVEGPDGVVLQRRRTSAMNPSLVAIDVAQLLWKAEVLSILSDLGVTKGVKSQPRSVLWTRLASMVSLEELRRLVRRQLKARGEGWRADG